MDEPSPSRARHTLTQGPITRSLLKLAWPVMLANLFHTLYHLVDMLWLGRLGKVAVAAPTIAWPLIFLVISIGSGVTIAGTALVAQFTGARRHEEANDTAGQVLAFTGILAVALAAVGAVAARPMMVVMGAGPDLLVAASSYLRIIFVGTPAMFGLFAFTALLNGAGDTVTPMVLMGVSVGLNIVLDPLLIFGWGPFPEWGVSGAAIASVLSRGLATAVALGLLFSGRLRVHLRLHHLHLTWRGLRQIVVIGVPAMLGQSGTALGFSLMTGILARFGTAAVSAFGIGNRVISIILMPVMGLGQATATIVGQNLGAGDPRRASRAAGISIGISTAVLVAGGILVFMFRDGCVRIFIDDPEVLDLGLRMFTLVAVAFPFMGVIHVVAGTYQGAGRTVYSMSFALFRLWALRIPLVYLLGFTLGLGPDGVWWAMLASNAGTALLSLGFFLTGNWRHRVIRPTAYSATLAGSAALQERGMGPKL